MPYYRHPSDWSPERFTTAIAAAVELANEYGNEAPTDPQCCTMCCDSYRSRLDDYNNLLSRADILAADLSTRTHHDPADAHAAKRAGETVTFWITDRERDRWRYREMERFSSGQYIPVPWSHLEPEDPPRFPHLSVKSPGLIAYTKSDEHGVLDRQTAIKPGRYLKDFFPDWSDDTIRDWVSRCQGITFELKIATTADDIIRVYRGGPSSCMSHDRASYSSIVHPVSVYGDSDLAIAYYGDIDHASARAVIWPREKRYGRIYGGAYTLQTLLEREGYKAGSMSGACVRAIPDRGTYVMPYVDGISHAGTVRRDGQRWIQLGDGDLTTSNTNGLAGDECDDDDPDYDDGSWVCDRCDEGQAEGDPSYNHHNGRYRMTICESCHDHLYVSCEHCDVATLRTAALSVDGTDYCESCYDDHVQICQRDGCNAEWFAARASDRAPLCNDCTADGWIVCNDCHTIARADADDVNGIADPDPVYAPHCPTCGVQLADTATQPLPLSVPAGASAYAFDDNPF
jgi:hypothetical protein